MTVEQLIKKLKWFDGNDHHVSLDVNAECGCLKVKCEIIDIKFKDGGVILTGNTDQW